MQFNHCLQPDLKYVWYLFQKELNLYTKELLVYNRNHEKKPLKLRLFLLKTLSNQPFIHSV